MVLPHADRKASHKHKLWKALHTNVWERHVGLLDDPELVLPMRVPSQFTKGTESGLRTRKLRRENPQARLIVTGCAAQTEPRTFADMPEVDQVIGNLEKMRAETWSSASTTVFPVTLMRSSGMFSARSSSRDLGVGAK